MMYWKSVSQAFLMSVNRQKCLLWIINFTICFMIVSNTEDYVKSLLLIIYKYDKIDKVLSSPWYNKVDVRLEIAKLEIQHM